MGRVHPTSRSDAGNYRELRNYGDGVDGAPSGIGCAKMAIVVSIPSTGKPSMRKSISKLETVTTVGLDLAKNVMQVHAVDAAGNIVVNKPIRRGKLVAFFAALPKCLVGIE